MEANIKMTEFYIEALTKAKANDQVVGENHDYYITLWQLETLLKTYYLEENQ